MKINYTKLLTNPLGISNQYAAKLIKTTVAAYKNKESGAVSFTEKEYETLIEFYRKEA